MSNYFDMEKMFKKELDERIHKAEELSSLGISDIVERVEILEHHLIEKSPTEELLAVIKETKTELEKYEYFMTTLLIGIKDNLNTQAEIQNMQVKRGASK